MKSISVHKNAFLLSAFLSMTFILCLLSFASTTDCPATITPSYLNNTGTEVQQYPDRPNDVLPQIKHTEQKKPLTIQQNVLLDSYNIYAEEDNDEEKGKSNLLLYVVLILVTATIGGAAGLFLYKNKKTNKHHETKELDALLNKAENLNNDDFSPSVSGLSDNIVKETERKKPIEDKEETIPKEPTENIDDEQENIEPTNPPYNDDMTEEINADKKEEDLYEPAEDIEENNQIVPEEQFNKEDRVEPEPPSEEEYPDKSNSYEPAENPPKNMFEDAPEDFDEEKNIEPEYSQKEEIEPQENKKTIYNIQTTELNNAMKKLINRVSELKEMGVLNDESKSKIVSITKDLELSKSLGESKSPYAKGQIQKTLGKINDFLK